MSEHEDIARRLREEGNAAAPPGLIAEVMAQVRAEPRRSTRLRRRARPLLGWAAAAAALVALGFGIAHLPRGGGSSSASSSGEAASSQAAAEGASRAPDASTPHLAGSPAPALTVDRGSAKRILGRAGVALPPADRRRPLRIEVPEATFAPLLHELVLAQRRFRTSPTEQPIVIRLVRAGTH